MKKLLILVCIAMIGSLNAQEVKPLYEKAGDLVKVTNFYENGAVKEQGFFKNKVITGVWNTYDKAGNKTAMAKYKNGKKVGKWFMWSKDGLKEINFENNTISSVQTWKADNQIAIK